MAPRANATAKTHSGMPAVEERCGVFSVDDSRVRRGRAALPPPEQTERIAGTFKILAHPTRVNLLRALASGEMCVCEISVVLGLSVSATSHQLRQLKDLRIVRSRSEGKLVHYSLQTPFLVSLLDDCAHHLAGQEART